MNASVHFSTESTRISRGSANSDGLARVMSSPGRYWSAASSLTSSDGSSARKKSRSERMARSARKSDGPLTSTTGAGRTVFHATIGMAGLAGGFAATQTAYAAVPTPLAGYGGRSLHTATSPRCGPGATSSMPCVSVRSATVPVAASVSRIASVGCP